MTTSPRALGFKGASKLLEVADIEAAAAELGVEYAKLRAVLHVEASGSGFDGRGRPKILYEAHVFWRNLPAGIREEANRRGLAWPHWLPGRYPRGSDAMYEQLEKACEMHEEAALKACSWGIAQILGENHKAVGYPAVVEMVLDAMKGEREQLDMLVAFIDNIGLTVPLRMGDWEAFAARYNGPSYRVNAYHTKMAEAYVRFRDEARLAPPLPAAPKSAAATPSPSPQSAPAPAHVAGLAGMDGSQGAGG
jgi:hypothetical protein